MALRLKQKEDNPELIGIDNNNSAEPIDDAAINQEVDALDDFDGGDSYENIGDSEEESDNIEGDFIAVTEELQQAITELLQRAIDQHGGLDLSHYNIHLGGSRNPGNNQAAGSRASDNRENSDNRESGDNSDQRENSDSRGGGGNSDNRDNSDNRYRNDNSDNSDIMPDNTAPHPNNDT